MNNNGKLYIIITDNPNIQSTQTTITKTTTTTTNTTRAPITGSTADEIGLNFAAHQFYHFMQQEATQAVNWSISNIGNFTGDYLKQTNVQQVVSLGSKLVGIGMSVVAGAQAGGLIGALVTGTIAVAGTVINTALENKSNAFQVQKQNYEIEKLKELSGLNTLTNGGRI